MAKPTKSIDKLAMGMYIVGIGNRKRGETMEEKVMIMQEIADQVKKLKEEDLRTLKGVAVGLQLAREQEEKKVG